ncbi:Serine-type D-Ala-D-Ala carboxypeptidase [Desulfotomaculum nigrificans CO-1-SRB]|uniref:serine-type D-Ala-D-Ala carboxypeptidase n=1 Tax=Desulfotomaculum nigrificans (strain DSM 14880 / VKM B-2319 / CO-1-SRB) TaxID=868595 RepID=F6B2S3_DESCC|nr:D-alanyl-D-alanine carboxypeptidase family protein [Desulfotomaculum nigrificans]AEF93902.1 Serine-type D-Ala-D-Ala carboxypeptidase [Desulfotomaculum nigrificans CO-1-SRB]
MKTRKYLIIFLCVMLLILGNPIMATGTPTKDGTTSDGQPPKVRASAACLMEVATGRIYFAKQGDKRREPASLTKIMTAILAIEKGNLKDVVTVGKKAAAVSMGQDIGLSPGDRLYLEDLLKAALMYSANDSTVAIGEHIAGSHDAFIKMMNDKAKVLGMKDTRYANTNGYHNPNHYTTAIDLAKLTCYALKNPVFASFVRTREATITWLPKEKTGNPQEVQTETPRQRVIHNTNALLESNFEGINGVKTGTTPRAGKCLIASATREGRQLVAVVLNSPNRWDDATNLLEYGFREFRPQVLSEKDEVMGEIPVVEGVEQKVTLVAAKKVEAYVARIDSDKVERKINLAPPPKAPIKQGIKLGKATFVLHGQEIATVDLVANRNIKRLPWFKRIFKK